MPPLRRRTGSGWQHGRPDSTRRSPPLSIPSPGQAKTCGRAHAAERDCVPVRSHSGAHHFHDPGCAVRGPLDRGGRNEGRVRREPAQRRHRVEGSPGPTSGGAQSRAIERDPRRLGLRSWLFIVTGGRRALIGRFERPRACAAAWHNPPRRRRAALCRRPAAPRNRRAAGARGKNPVHRPEANLESSPAFLVNFAMGLYNRKVGASGRKQSIEHG